MLGVAWFGAIVLGAVAPRFKWAGLGLMLASGLLLFALHPGMYYGSISFRIKMALLLLLCLPLKLTRTAILTVWIAIIFASRGIAFF